TRRPQSPKDTQKLGQDTRTIVEKGMQCCVLWKRTKPDFLSSLNFGKFVLRHGVEEVPDKKDKYLEKVGGQTQLTPMCENQLL
ncbi:hypothetical protein DSO57_1026339, partial [Entomophthora muscae]